jgi:ABC-type phosphate transport system permease subunit
VRAHSAAEVATGMVALVAALVELLGRIIGEEMAVELVNQAVGSAPVAKGKSKTRPLAGAYLRRQH